MSKGFRDWNVEQTWLLPPSVQELVPEGHRAHLVRELVRESLGLSAIFNAYKRERGSPPFNPAMMTALLLYAYTQGVFSSRKIARACEERLDFMAVTGMQRPEHRTVCEFRRRHLPALGALFVQVLRICQRMGMVKLGRRARWDQDQGERVEVQGDELRADEGGRARTGGRGREVAISGRER